MSTTTGEQEPYKPRNAAIPLAIMIVLWIVGAGLWLTGGELYTSGLLVYVGLIVGVGLGLYLALPRRKRPLGRRVMFLMVGTLLLALALLTDHGNMQIEGLFFALLAVAAPYIILHYLLAKIAGPLVFGRVWCGWACWFAMIFDLLPYPYSRYRIPGRWGLLRYVHFLGSLTVVALLVFVFGYRDGALGDNGLEWFVAGLAAYYAIGIVMAMALKDNRAFCKYLCPISVPLKLSSRFALLKVTGTADKCGDCVACIEMCPMNIRVRDYIDANERVMSTECTMCQTCINVCPHDSLRLSLGFDRGGKELIDYEPPRYRRR